MSRKSSKKHARRRARENALAILYSSDIIESSAMSIVEEGRYPVSDIHLSEYAESLVEGVSEHLEEIDAKLVATSENWALDRMPVVDRAILRLAVYEMLYVDEVPVSVAINEAVELAKAYGGEDESSRFVNGVLGRISRLEDGVGTVAQEPVGEDGTPEAAEKVAAGAEGVADAEEGVADAEEGVADAEGGVAANQAASPEAEALESPTAEAPSESVGHDEDDSENATAPAVEPVDQGDADHD